MNRRQFSKPFISGGIVASAAIGWVAAVVLVIVYNRPVWR